MTAGPQLGAAARRARLLGQALTLAGSAAIAFALLPLDRGWAEVDPGSAGRPVQADDKGKDAPKRAGAEEKKDGEKRRRGTTSRGDRRFDDGRRRYAEALGIEVPEGELDQKRPAGFGRAPDKSVLVLDRQSVAAMLERGWAGMGRGAESPRRQAERVRTFVAIARALDLRPGIGALQATFGTPGENGLAGLAQALDAAREALAARPGHPDLAAAFHEREREFNTALAGLPRGPQEDWALVDLDVNGDRSIDRTDLELARAMRDAPQAEGAIRSASRERLGDREPLRLGPKEN